VPFGALVLSHSQRFHTCSLAIRFSSRCSSGNPFVQRPDAAALERQFADCPSANHGYHWGTQLQGRRVCRTLGDESLALIRLTNRIQEIGRELILGKDREDEVRLARDVLIDVADRRPNPISEQTEAIEPFRIVLHYIDRAACHGRVHVLMVARDAVAFTWADGPLSRLGIFPATTQAWGCQDRSARVRYETEYATEIGCSRSLNGNLEPVLLERESTNRKEASPKCEVVV
jgi:hypothetical protein